MPRASTFYNAGQLFPKELISLDSIHLASALELDTDLNGIVTYGPKISEAANYSFNQRNYAKVSRLELRRFCGGGNRATREPVPASGYAYLNCWHHRHTIIHRNRAWGK